MSHEATIIDSFERLEIHIARLREDFHTHKYLIVPKVKTGKQRSNQQNAALHAYCFLLADALNSAGYDMQKVLAEKSVSVPWTKETVKDCLWRPIQEAMTGEESTTKPERGQYPEIYDVLNRHMGEKFGVSVAWPTREAA